MSRVTNVLNLPDAIVQAVANDDYSRGSSDITVTELIDPPRKVALTRQHEAEIVEDASDRIYALMGQAIHNVLERANVADSVEERLYTTVLGWNVGGKYDHLALTDDREFGRILSDYKSVSVWEIVHGLKPERIQQLNILGWLARLNGYRVDRLEAVCIIRDWSKPEARRRPEDYPQRQVMRYFVPTWTDEKTAAFVEERVRLHQDARERLPECSNEDRWYKGTKYAVIKGKTVKGEFVPQKRAARVLDSLDDAMQWARDNGLVSTAQFGDIQTEALEGATIQTRVGEHTRCEHYCSVASWCSQFAQLKAQQTDGDETDDAEGAAA